MAIEKYESLDRITLPFISLMVVDHFSWEWGGIKCHLYAKSSFRLLWQKPHLVYFRKWLAWKGVCCAMILLWHTNRVLDFSSWRWAINSVVETVWYGHLVDDAISRDSNMMHIITDDLLERTSISLWGRCWCLICVLQEWLRQFVFVTNYTCDLLAVSVASKKGGEKAIALGEILSVFFPPLQKRDKKRKIPQTFFFICCFVVKSTFISFDPCPILLKASLHWGFIWGGEPR